jgi:hypothetical protein
VVSILQQVQCGEQEQPPVVEHPGELQPRASPAEGAESETRRGLGGRSEEGAGAAIPDESGEGKLPSE